MTVNGIPEGRSRAALAGVILLALLVATGLFLWLLLAGGSGDADGRPVLDRPLVTGLALECRPDPVLTVRIRSGNARRATARATVSRSGTTVSVKSRTARPTGRKATFTLGLGSMAGRVLPSCEVPRGVAVSIRVTSRLGSSAKTVTRALRGRALRAEASRRVLLGPVGSPVSEASGLAESRFSPGRFYTHDDSGGEASVYVLAEDGSVRATVPLAGTTNRDWEDIAIGPGPKGDSVYVGDIGDNAAVHDSIRVHRIPEPSLEGVAEGATLDPITPETVEFTYPDGPRDAEALVVDPAVGDIYVITKREDSARVYRASEPEFGGAGTTELEFVGELDYAGVVAADACPDGETVLTKTYFNVYAHVSGAGIEAALGEPGLPRLYLPDFEFAQDEALAADPWCSGYSVLPEGSRAPLARYVP